MVLSGAGLLIQFAFLSFCADGLGLHGGLPGTSALVVGTGLGILFRYGSYRTWVWRAPQPVSSLVA
jgi:putative flippase GtrA